MTLLVSAAVGQTSVPPLACFGETPIAKYDLSAVESDLSGVDISGTDGRVWAVNNGDAKIFELEFGEDMTATPTLLGSWSVKDSILDPESIAYVEGRTFLVTDENPSSVFSCVFPESSEESAECTPVSSGLPTPAGENLGFEGVAYLQDGSIFAAQEMRAPAVWSIDQLDGTETPVIADASLELDPPLIVFGDMTSSYSSTDEFFLLSKLPAGVFRVSGIGGIDNTAPSITDQYAGQICDMGQPEGIAFFQRNGLDYMIIAGEPTQVRIFQAEPGCSLSLNATIGTLFQCPEKTTVDVGCEKDFQDGGCEYSRCNKATTPHDKVCTDTTPGITDCSEMECMGKCVNGTIEGAACTHWAYDAKESECYIFAGCNDIGFDADYTQYILQDPTCEKILEDGGCEMRRCDKNTNVNEKVCTDTIPGTTDCSLEQCHDVCVEYLNFTCTTFAYDEVEKECYVFETCDNEGDDEDYTTYVLVDPTCDDSLTEGGCTQRRCSTLTNNNDKVFSGDAETVEQCQLACATYLEFDCKYYAHDPVDQDCIVFETCAEEGFHDDYTLYVMGYDEKSELIAENGGNGMCGATLNTGGCETQRCAKEDNMYNKICTDDSEETQCTLAECQDHCSVGDDFECKFYAYDELESECYLFSNCIGQTEDADYTTYARTCGKTRMEAGCADRRCDKDSNNHEKVCENGVSECTLEECEAFCDNWEGGECSFFAYEASESECYVFESCFGEHDDEYVLYARACSKTYAEGGCTGRRCDKDLTAHVKTCTDDTPGVTDCLVDDCKRFCDDNIDKNGDDLGFTCNWFAFEYGPNECYLFEECRNESPDDYVMYIADNFGHPDDMDHDHDDDMDDKDNDDDDTSGAVSVGRLAIFIVLGLLSAHF